MYQVQYAMFFDFHTMKNCPEVGHRFDADAFAASLADAGVDLVGVHAKCNQGFCYYDTQKGTRHPSLPRDLDLFGEAVAACARRKVAVTAYFNCGLSNESALEHPEWCVISPEHRILRPDIYDLGEVTPYMRTMCMNSPWRDYLMELIEEVAVRYDVVGFLFDSFNGFPCVCPHCIKGMKEQGFNWRDPEEVTRFARQSCMRLAEEIASRVRKHKKDPLLYFLGVSALDNARIGKSYLECECLPTNPGWGYDYLPLMAHYMRTISPGQVLNMTGRFYDWGDFGSLRPAAAVLYDLFYGLANGMRPNIGDHLLPSGAVNHASMQRVKEIYDTIRPYEPWYRDTTAVAEIGVVLPEPIDKSPSLIGVTRMLSELKMQFNFIDTASSWDDYDVLILPDEVVIEGEIARRIAGHLAEGRKILSTGTSGIDRSGSAFVFPEAWGVTSPRPCPFDPVYFHVTPSFAPAVSDMAIAPYTDGVAVDVLDGTKVMAHVVKSYFNREWDGIYSHFYTPPAEDTTLPFVTMTEQVVYTPFRIFAGYYKRASVDVRHLFAAMLKRALPKPILVCDSSLPSFARAFVRRRGEKELMVHLLNYLPELRGKSLIVEEAFRTPEVSVKVRTSGRRATSVILAPGDVKLDYRIEKEYVCFTVPEVKGYALAVVRFE